MQQKSKSKLSISSGLASIIFVFLVAGWLIFAVGCGISVTGTTNSELEPVTNTSENEDGEEPAELEELAGNLADLPRSGLTEEEMTELGVNELGQVMVLMYHVIGDQESQWARTRDNFRQDLKRLYDLGYRSVTLTDFVTGNIDLPAGTSPIVLTFDDGTIGQFRFLEENDGKLAVDPDSGVGIMLDFAREYPEFGTHATFYVNFPYPFGQPKYWEEKLRFLAENGMEIGNHSFNHTNLSKLTDGEVQQELALAVRRIQLVIPGYQVNSLALPFGVSAKNKILEMTGELEGTSYNHLAVLRVGANPGYPPGHQKFDPARVPRVQATQSELARWLDYLEKNPHLKYVSDGNKDTLVIPEREGENLALEAVGDREVIFLGES